MAGGLRGCAWKQMAPRWNGSTPPLQAVSPLLSLRSEPPHAEPDSAVIAPNFLSWQVRKAAARG